MKNKQKERDAVQRIKILHQKEEIALRIKTLRQEKKETQAQLAKAIETTQYSISKIENAQMSLTLDNLLYIADHYGVSVNYLCTGIRDNNTLDILSSFISLRYRDTSFGEENHYCYPILQIRDDYFSYLLKIANICKFQSIPNDIKEEWIKREADTFEKTKDSEFDMTPTVPMPLRLIAPTDDKKDWSALDLEREVTLYYRDY